LKVNIIRLDIAKMTYEPTNSELYSIIQRLCSKIENLEKKIDRLSENRETNIDKVRRKGGLDAPDLYGDWLTFIKVEKKHYDNLFTLHGGVLTTFKDIVLEHINVCDSLPLYKHKKSVYVYQTIDDEPEWCLFDNDSLIKMVQEVWRKLLSIQLNDIHIDKDDDEIKDQKRRVVIQMRQKLCETKSNREDILKWIKNVI